MRGQTQIWDTCYWEQEDICTFEEDCSHKDEDGSCNASDDKLMTYEDYLQWKETKKSQSIKDTLSMEPKNDV